MSKVNLNNLVNLQNESSAVNIINNNNDAIETFSDDVLSRTGKTPNTMESQLDMNSNHIINLPEPTVGTEPVRLQDIETIIDPEQTGNVTSIASSTAGGEVPIFSGNTGKIISKYSGTGIVKSNTGVLSNAVQGTDFWQPGGTDVAIADGGTGASTALAAFNNLKQPSTTSYVGAVQLATTTEANTGTDTAKAVTAAGVNAYYNGHINTSLAPYSKITRTWSSGPNANYTLSLADAGNIVITGSTTPMTITIPANASVAFPAVTQIDFIQNGAGKVTFAGANANVVILSKNGFKSLSGTYSACTLVFAGVFAPTEYWWLFGDLTT